MKSAVFGIVVLLWKVEVLVGAQETRHRELKHTPSDKAVYYRRAEEVHQYPPHVSTPKGASLFKLKDAAATTAKAILPLEAGATLANDATLILNSVDNEVKTALTLIEDAKKQLVKGHKEHACDLVDLTKSIIDAVLSQLALPSGFVPLAGEKIDEAISKVEAYIQWSTKTGYSYAGFYVEEALDALNEAAAAIDAAIATSNEVRDSYLSIFEALAGTTSALESAIAICNSDSAENLKEALAAVADALKEVIVAIGPTLVVVTDAAKILIPAASVAVEEALDALNRAIYY